MKRTFKRAILSKSNISRPILFNYLKTEVAIILILCLGTGLIYWILNNSLRNQIINVNKVLLQNTISSIEKEFSNLNEITSLINSNQRVIKCMNILPHIKKNAQNYNAYEVTKDLNTYVYSNRFVKGIHIYFNNDVVISNEYKTDFNFYFEHLDLQDYDVRSMISTFNHRRMLYVKDEEGNLQKIFYINSLPVGSRKMWKATVVIEIDLDMIPIFLQDNQFTMTTETILLNSEQTVISIHNPMAGGWENTDAIKTTVKSETLEWEIVSVIPETEFEAELMSIRSTIIFILLLSLVVGLVLAVFSAYKHYKPVARLIGIVNEDRTNVTNEDVFNNIEKSISTTLNENKELKRKIQRQTEYLTDSMVEKLLKNEIVMGKSTDEIVDWSDISFKSAKIVVLSIKLHISNTFPINYPDIISKLQKWLEKEQDGYVFYLNESNISILVEIINREAFNPREFGAKIINMLDKLNIRSTVGVGGIHSPVKGVNRSYKEALFSLNTLHKDKGEVIIYDSIKHLAKTNTKYYYPISIEKEIINNVKIGNIERVQELLEEVYNKNFMEIQLSGQISRILIYNIISTAIKIMDDLKIDLEKFEDANILRQLYKSEIVNDAYSSLISAYTIICQLINENKKSSNIYLFKKIEKYLNDEYENPGVTLVITADKFDLSPSYLSRFFKEHAGINFNDYLQKLRIDKAKEIFSQCDNVFIEQVANMVGYTNSSALIRAFKRYEGITPGEYRSGL